MIEPALQRELLEQMAALKPNQQRQVLDYACRLAGKLPPGVPGKSLLKFAGAIPLEDVERMEQAIREGCG